MKFFLYQDRKHKWHWRLVGDSGVMLLESGEGYNGIGNVRRSLKAFKHAIGAAKIIEVKTHENEVAETTP